MEQEKLREENPVIKQFREEHQEKIRLIMACSNEHQIARLLYSVVKDQISSIQKEVGKRQKLFDFIPQDEYGYKRVKTDDLDIISLLDKYKK